VGDKRGSPIRKLFGADQLEDRAHFDVGTAPRELGRNSPQVGAAFAVKGLDPETMLLDMMSAAEAHPESVVWLLAHAGIGR
jgi:hypothetical protein